MEKEKLDLDYHYAFILAAIATMLAGAELEVLEKYISDDGFKSNPQIKKNFKLSKIAYNLWISRIWEIDKTRAVKCEDLHLIHQQCTEIVKKLKNDVVVFKSTIAQYMIDDDIIYENTLSEMIVICSLLNLGVKVSNIIIKGNYSEHMMGVFERLKPQQIFTNVNRIYKYLPTPDDFDVDKSEKVHAAMDILVKNIEKLYIEEFTDGNKI